MIFPLHYCYSVFDSLLYRPSNENDIESYEKVQRVLREEIVNPLRKNLFVRADRVMNLRTLLNDLTSVTGLTCEEKGTKFIFYFVGEYICTCTEKTAKNT